MMTKGMKDLARKANRLIKKQGYFLLHYDVVGSVKFAEKRGYADLYGRLEKFHALVNEKFKNCIVKKETGLNRELKKFRTIVGDSGGAYFFDSKVIIPITELAEKTLPFRLRWGIAKNGWDRKSFEKKNMS